MRHLFLSNLAPPPVANLIKLLKECEYYSKRLDFSKNRYKIRAVLALMPFEC